MTILPDLTSLDAYRRSCLELAAGRLAGYSSIQDIGADLDELNAYERLDRLSEPRDVHILDRDSLAPADLEKAREAVLDGRVFWEHTAAGEATRLKLGTKYLIYPPRDLMPLEKIAAMISDETGRPVDAGQVRSRLKVSPDALLPLDLGLRHMLQLAFDLVRLAEDAGRDPADVLARQTVFTVLNEKSAERIMALVREARFHGFRRENCLFMIQPAFAGIALREGRFAFDPDSPFRLHNHGQLAMQETMDGQIFRLDESGRPMALSADAFQEILGGCLDKISYNIEDLDYLTGSVGWNSLALALKLGREGYHMVMEIVANNPDKPIKGGLAAYDEVLKRNVMIESFQLKGLPNEEILFLNKNFNHYTNPVMAWGALKERKLPMPLAVKGGYLYFQPVQGDINFLVPTAFVRRKKLKPIRAWKSAANIIDAVNTMDAQDRQPGFRAFAARVLDRDF